MNFHDFLKTLEEQIPPLPLGIGPGLALSQIGNAAPRLIKSLRQCNGASLLAQIGGLLTDPRLHPNTLRLEILAHLAFAHAQGHKTVKRKTVVHFLNRDLQRL